jgi:hypothetical protein
MDTVLYLIEKSVLNPTTSTGQTFLVALFAMWVGSCINVNNKKTARRKSQSNTTNK